jgi:hypothetical protein
MTEQEWRSTDQVPTLLPFLDGKLTQRKLRLFASSCIRMIWHLLPDDSTRQMAEMIERLADGSVTTTEYCLTINAARRTLERSAQGWLYLPLLRATSSDLTSTTTRYLAQKVWLASDLRGDAANRLLAGFLRDIAGNPFRPIKRDVACLTPTVVSLAEAAYEERILPSGELDRDRLAVLSDALEDAGCSDVEMLDHLRRPGPHVRGCFAVDLCLARS